uniref:LOC100125371 protein n=1 Tax=Rattus norvegicus TaxID=10116 RepID=Q5HZA8_RAT|nr:LOC100125371 protein [Rattus norvegicus]
MNSRVPDFQEVDL